MRWGHWKYFLIIFHALRLLWVMLVDVMTSSHLFSSFMLFISALPVSMKGRLHIVSYTLTGSLNLLIDRVCSLFYILLEYTS